MKKYILSPLLCIPVIIFGLLLSCNNSPKQSQENSKESTGKSLTLRLVSDQIQSPVALSVPGDGTNRLFICQKEGKVWIIENDKKIADPFLNVSDQMVSINPGYDERGLLGMAFHPDFKTNHKFYVYFSAPSKATGSDHKSIIAEFKVSATDPNKADMNSKRVVMEIEEPESNHNGGDLVFGPDGNLYIGLGDGGGGGDRHGTIGNGQNLNTWLGKILRINIDGQPYTIPKDNPFVDSPGHKPEIWAYGLRNPWRFSFDKPTKRLFAGDVGQDKYEEIDIIEKGGNYGWRIKEGLHDFNVPAEGINTKMIDPVYEYNHDIGISIIGGYVYHGKALPWLEGKYIYGDYNGKLWTLTNTGGNWENNDLAISKTSNDNLQLLSFGEDENGEIYVLASFSSSSGARGGVFRLAPGDSN